MMTDTELKLLGRIVTEPGKMGGKSNIRGRRITPAMVLNMLANGATREQVLDAYPVLQRADIDACLLYAARLSERSQSDDPPRARDRVPDRAGNWGSKRGAGDP